MVKNTNPRPFGHRRQPISKYDKNGYYIESFRSIYAAGMETGIEQSGICMCAKGKLKTSGGFIWRYGLSEERLGPESYTNMDRHNNRFKGRPIQQYDRNGNFIKEYPSIKQANNETGIHPASISRNAGGHLKSAGGYKWQYAS